MKAPFSWWDYPYFCTELDPSGAPAVCILSFNMPVNNDVLESRVFGTSVCNFFLH